MTRGKFAKRVCDKLNIEWTEHVRRAFAAWMQAEGGSAKFNPLNTTLKEPGSTTLAGNTAGVQNYVSGGQGIDATAKTLRERDHGYEKILRRMRVNAPAWAIIDAIIESDWGTGKEDDPGDDTVIEKVLVDIQHDRKPNTLRELEAKTIAH
jgi:hypothetical protein